MDFSLIKRHPWWTAFIIVSGAFLVYLWLRGRSSSSSDSGGGYQGTYVAGQAQDPNAASIALAQQQIQAQLSATQIGANTQLGLATIAAGPNYTVAQSADVQNNATAAQLSTALAQISAQLQLGTGAQSSQVEMARINADLQKYALDALSNAYGGHTATSPSPIQQNPPLTSAGYSTPTFNTSTPVALTAQAPTPQTTTSGGSMNDILPGGTLLVPYPNYANCDPHDVSCVANNQTLNVNWENSVIQRNAQNNRAQCLANAELNKGFANYGALVAACG